MIAECVGLADMQICSEVLVQKPHEDLTGCEKKIEQDVRANLETAAASLSIFASEDINRDPIEATGSILWIVVANSWTVCALRHGFSSTADLHLVMQRIPIEGPTTSSMCVGKGSPDMKKPSSKIREEIARLQDQLKQAETREAERIGRLALKAGLGDIQVEEDELVSAFEELVGRFRNGHSPNKREGGDVRPSALAQTVQSASPQGTAEEA
jgi:hypothetical protein